MEGTLFSFPPPSFLVCVSSLPLPLLPTPVPSPKFYLLPPSLSPPLAQPCSLRSVITKEGGEAATLWGPAAALQEAEELPTPAGRARSDSQNSRTFSYFTRNVPDVGANCESHPASIPCYRLLCLGNPPFPGTSIFSTPGSVSTFREAPSSCDFLTQVFRAQLVKPSTFQQARNMPGRPLVPAGQLTSPWPRLAVDTRGGLITAGGGMRRGPVPRGNTTAVSFPQGSQEGDSENSSRVHPLGHALQTSRRPGKDTWGDKSAEKGLVWRVRGVEGRAPAGRKPRREQCDARHAWSRRTSRAGFPGFYAHQPPF